jgi:uncharacterized protein
LKELVVTFARFLVEDPDRVFVRERTEKSRLVLELSVAREDRGRVIGRGGRTAAALRTVLDAVAARRGQSCVLEILD